MNDSKAAIRRYDLDWIRVFAVAMLVPFHTGMIYVFFGWHIKRINLLRFPFNMKMSRKSSF